MNIRNTPHNQRIKYAWYRYRGLPIVQAKRLSRRAGVPQELLDDLENYFYYIDGRLIRDYSEGANNAAQEEFSKNY